MKRTVDTPSYLIGRIQEFTAVVFMRLNRERNGIRKQQQKQDKSFVFNEEIKKLLHYLSSILSRHFYTLQCFSERFQFL